MFIIIRFFIYTLPLVIFAVFEFLRNYPSLLTWGAVFISLWLLLVIWYILRHSVRKKGDNMLFTEWINYFITPLLLVLSGVAFLIFFNNIFFYRLVALFVAFSSFLFLENLFIYLYFPKKYILSSLENVSSYLNIVISFFLYSAYYGLTVFLHLQSRWLFVLLIVLNVILLLQTFFINKLKLKNVWLALLLALVIFIQVVWAIQYLPFTFLVKGVMVSLVYYTVSGLFRYYFLQLYNRKILLRHVLIVVLVTFFLLFTAKWL